MQQPSIGRIVHYQAYGTPGGEHPSAPRAAIISALSTPEVNDAGQFVAVDLVVLNPTGMFFNQSVRFSETPKPGHWSWPPFVPPTK